MKPDAAFVISGNFTEMDNSAPVTLSSPDPGPAWDVPDCCFTFIIYHISYLRFVILRQRPGKSLEGFWGVLRTL